MMKATNIEERLALVGVLLVLLGVSSAAQDALAVETADLTTTAVAIHSAADNTRAIAAEANAESAATAAKALAAKNWLDLDIRLDDHTSTLNAGRK